MSQPKMRVLVTGGAGFLGSHLCDALLAEGHSVIAVDNLLTGRVQNLEHLKREPRFEFRKLDICEPFDPGKVEYVHHFACPASPVDYMTHGIGTLQVGSAGTFNTLEVARKYGATFFLASTSECYGDPQEHPQTESYWGNVNPVGPRSVYDEAKRFSEAATVAYRRYHKLQIRIVRIFNTYGPRMRPRDGRAIPTFIRQALAGEALTVAGDGQQTRSICFVDDLVTGILAFAALDHPGPVNIGNPEELTVRQIAEDVVAATGSASQIVHVERPVDDPQVRRPDTTLARELLGWAPAVEWQQGLARTVEWFADQQVDSA
jgi:dTDP-glucose 4,6-dehydratase